jgi:hypothetical protein
MARPHERVLGRSLGSERALLVGLIAVALSGCADSRQVSADTRDRAVHDISEAARLVPEVRVDIQDEAPADTVAAETTAAEVELDAAAPEPDLHDAALSCPRCCKDDADCMDCVDLVTGISYPCPQGPADGALPNLCTNSFCTDGHCQTTDKLLAGLCDLGDFCSADGCDPTSGECIHLFLPCDQRCMGSTQQEADSACNPSTPLCSTYQCYYPDGFVPWDRPKPPEDWASPALGWCVPNYEPMRPECGDGNPCTQDYCNPGYGCMHAYPLEPLPGCAPY